LNEDGIFAAVGIHANTVGTSSWAISASWAPGGSGGTSLTTGSTYPITASWAQTASVVLGSIESASYSTYAESALSASYAPSATDVLMVQVFS